MSARRIAHWRCAVALLLGGVLAGCAGDPPPPTNFYELSAPETGVRFETPLLDGTVVVERFDTEGVLNERALLYKRSDGPQLRQYSYHYWASPPASLIRDAVIAAYRQANAARRVVSPRLRLLPDFRVTGRVEQLYHHDAAGDDEGRQAAVIALEITLTRARDGAVLLLDRYTRRRPLSGSGVPAAVQGMEGALGDILDQSLRDLARRQGRVTDGG